MGPLPVASRGSRVHWISHPKCLYQVRVMGMLSHLFKLHFEPLVIKI